METKYYTKELAEILEKLVKQQQVQVAKAIMQQLAIYRQLQKMNEVKGINRGQRPTEKEMNLMKSLAMAVLDDAEKRKLQR